MRRFEDKIVLITGGAGGLGSEQCRVFAEEGALLAINYLDIDDCSKKAKTLANDLKRKYGGDHQLFAADVTKEEDVQKMVTDIVSRFGKIDVLVNNAGISSLSVAWKVTSKDWSNVLSVNLTGAMNCSKAVLQCMRERRYGRIINITSIIGLQGAAGSVAYASSKAGLVGMCKTMARELADCGITVNCVAPGFISSGLIDKVSRQHLNEAVLPAIPMHRLGEAIDIAKAVAFLASDDAKYITGEVLRVDGGQAM